MNRHLSRSGAASSSRAVAPFHRGPAAVAAHSVAHTAAHSPAPLSAQMGYAPNAALLIDFDNVTMGIRSDLQEELKNLLSSDIIKGKVAVRRAYADWRRYQQYVVPLTEASIDLIFAPAYGSSKKNATDIRLAIDALELVFTRPEIGTFVLLSGDSDFSSMVIKLKEYGKYVIGVGIRESSSDLLVMNCDEYYSYNALAGLVRSGEDETTRWDPWELVTEAVGRMKRNGDVMRSDRLKQVMQDIDASFDEKNLGYPKFSRFVLEAQTRNLVRVSKLESGQLEVDAVENTDGDTAQSSGATSTETATSSADAGVAVAGLPAGSSGEKAEHSESDREERRGRRSRRGGRGRDRRDRDETGSAARSSSLLPELGIDVFSPRPATDAGLSVKADEKAEVKAEVKVDAQAEAKAFAKTDAESVLTDPIGIRPLPSEAVDSTQAARDRHRGSQTDSLRGALPAPFNSPVAADVGRSGERLTRTDAFELVRKAVDSLVSGDAFTSASLARQRAFELLGRNSESLSARMFERILQDAHDAGLIDLRRRGDDWEVARAAEAESIVDQLKTAEAAQKAEESRTAIPQQPVVRGMSARGIGGRGGNGRSKEVPPELLMVGVVAPVGAVGLVKPVASESTVQADVKAEPSVEETATKAVANAATKAASTTATTTATKAASKAVDKATGKAAGKTAAKAAGKAAGKAAAKAADKPLGKTSGKTATKVAVKSGAKVAGQAASKSATKSTAKTAARTSPAKASSARPSSPSASRVAKKAAKAK